MGMSFLGMNIPTSLDEVGANLHNNFRPAIAQAAPGAKAAVANLPGVGFAGAAARGLQDFYHGLVTGHALGQDNVAPQTTAKAQAKAKTSAPAAATSQPLKLPDGSVVKGPTAAFLAAHPASPWVDTPATSDGKAVAAAVASGNPVQDAIKQYMGGGGGLSLNQLAVLAHAQGDAEPRGVTKAPSTKDVVGANIFALQQQRLASDLANADARSKALGISKDDFVNKATQGYIQSLMPIVGTSPTDAAVAQQFEDHTG